jgi:hypothetical protein
MFVDPTGTNPLAILIGVAISMASYGISIAISDAPFNFGQFFLAGVIGVIAGGVGGAVGGAVASALPAKVSSGFVGGALSGAAGGATSGFLGGSVNAWVNGAGLKDGLLAGLMGAGIGMAKGGLMEGLAGGFSAKRDGYSFWNGEITYEIPDFVSSPTNRLIMSDSDLQSRFYNATGKRIGDYGLTDITTNPDGDYVMNNNFSYTNTRTGGTTGGYFRGFQDRPGGSIHISPKYAMTSDALVFKAIARHELIHAYHHYTLGPAGIKDIWTEHVAYNDTIRVFRNAGRTMDLFGNISTSRRLGLYDVFPLNSYGIPF